MSSESELMSTASDQYRLSLVGQDLQDTIKELIEHNYLREEYANLVLEHFDKVILDLLKKQVRNNASISGSINHYRNYNDIWVIYLQWVDIRMKSESLVSGAKTKIIAVPKQ